MTGRPQHVDAESVGVTDVSPLMKPREVAQIFGVTTRTIRNWDRAGHLCSQRVGRSVFYLRCDIDALLGVEVATHTRTKTYSLSPDVTDTFSDHSPNNSMV